MMTILTKLIGLLFPRSAKEEGLESLPLDAYGRLPRGASFENIVPLFRYQDETVRGLIWLLKYKKSDVVADRFATLVTDHLLEELGERKLFESNTRIVLAPIPSRKARRVRYGYNPPLEILKRIDLAGVEVALISDLFEKKHETPRQTDLTRNERKQNMQGNLVAQDPQRIEGAHVVILDDVTTTGATLKDAERAAKVAGARSVTLVALAH